MIHVGGARDLERSNGGHRERDGESDRKKQMNENDNEERSNGKINIKRTG